MKKSIISLILISAIVLSTAIALADTETSWSPASPLVNSGDGWTVSNGAFGGSLSGSTGVFSISPSTYSLAAYPLPTSSNGNFDLDIPFTMYGSGTSLFVGLTTASDPTVRSGWTVIGNDSDGNLGYSTTGIGVQDLGTTPYSDGTEYYANFASTDGGHTATLSVNGYTGSVNVDLSGAPTYVIMLLTNNGITGDGANTPDVNGITYDYYQANASASPTPTPTAVPAATSPDFSGVQAFYASQPVVHMSNQSVIYWPNGRIKQVIGGSAATTPMITPVVSATPKPPVNATTSTVTPPTVTAMPVTPSATQTKSPGFEIALAAIGMILALALISRKK
jgi:hypothetical protein